MSYLALARRYRPADFDNIQSQHHITRTLRNAVKLGRISHAYLFCGPRGTGKTTTARVLAKALNCEKGPTPDPCGECTVCKEIALGSSPDVFEIDAASNRGIDDIRDLRENVRYTPVGGRYKIYIIDEIHRLTKEAFDALLKTLEEPPAHVIFIFATTEPQSLPGTILSRTQRYDFKRIPVSALAEAVNSVALKEGLSIDPNAALLIAKKADGSFRDALSLLDQLLSFSGGNISGEMAAEILGLVKTELLFSLSESIITHDTKSALNILREYISDGGDPSELSEAFTGYIRNLMLIKNGIDDLELLEMDKSELSRARELLTEIDTADILRYFTLLADYKASLRQGQDPNIGLEVTMVKLANLDRAVSLETLLKKQAGPQSTDFPPKAGKSETKSQMSHSKDLSNFEFSSGDSLKSVPQPSPDIGFVPTDSIDFAYEKAISPTGNVIEDWDGFCKFLSHRNKSKFAMLSICKPQKLEADVLTLLINSGFKIHHEQLSKPENKSFLESMLLEYFKKNIRLNFLSGTANTSNNVERSSSGLETDKSQAVSLLNDLPPVKKLYDLLDGEILEQ